MRTQLSIVIPHRNTPEKLRRLLDSIPESPRIDVVVVDDNSDLGLEANQLRPDYAQVRFFVNPGPDHNAGSARNHGLDQVRSEWVVFADADDYFVNDGLDMVLASIDSANAETDIVFFDVTSLSEQTGSLGRRHVGRSERLDALHTKHGTLNVRYGWPSPWAKAIRRDLLTRRQIRFDSVLAGNDVIFSQLCGHHAREIRYQKSTVYCVTESNNSLTTNVTPERALCRLNVLVRANNNLLEWGLGDIRKDWGLTWFIKSRPWNPSLKKIKIYHAYIGYIYKRLKGRLLRVMQRFTVS